MYTWGGWGEVSREAREGGREGARKKKGNSQGLNWPQPPSIFLSPPVSGITMTLDLSKL